MRHNRRKSSELVRVDLKKVTRILEGPQPRATIPHVTEKSRPRVTSDGSNHMANVELSSNEGKSTGHKPS